MRGMLDTILNVGATPGTVTALQQATGNSDFASSCYSRFLHMFDTTVLHIPIEKLAEGENYRLLRRADAAILFWSSCRPIGSMIAGTGLTGRSRPCSDHGTTTGSVDIARDKGRARTRELR